MSGTSANKLLLQELTQLIEINCLFCVFNKCLLLSPNFQGANVHFTPPADAHGGLVIKKCTLLFSYCGYASVFLNIVPVRVTYGNEEVATNAFLD